MNCRVGDMALVVRGASTGMAVTCLQIAGDSIILLSNDTLIADGPIWQIDRPVIWGKKSGARNGFPYCPDTALQPIRPDDLDIEIEEALETA